MSRLRIRREVFSHGVLSVDLLHLQEAHINVIAQQLSLAVLSHSSGTTAALPFTGWINQAQELFRSTEIVARLYFETFLTVHNKNVHRQGGPRLLLSADLGEFLLFLHLQKYRPLVNQQHTNNQSPHSLSSPTSRSSQRSSNVSTRQQTPLDFIVANLHIILSLIRDPHKHVHDISVPVSPHSAHSPLTPPRSPLHSQSSQTHQSTSHLYLEPHEFNRLAFLFYAHDPKVEHAEHLELVTENQEMVPPEQRSEVMNLSVVTPFFQGSNDQAVPISLVQEWLMRHLTEHEINVSNSYARPTLSHGHLLYPPSVKLSHVNNIRDKHVVLRESDVEGGDLLISGCSDSNISVLTHSRYATIEDVHNSVIQCGTVGSLLVVRRCSSLTLTVASRVVHFAEVRHLRVYLFSAMRPVILGTSNSDICLAPYNTYYPALNSDLSVISVASSTNCWSSPVIVSHASGSTSAQLLHSPMRGSRGLSSTLSVLSQSPPPPSSPRRSSSPSPLLSPLSHTTPPPVSSPTSPFKRTMTHPSSPSSSTSSINAAANSLSPSDRSPNGSLLSPVHHRRHVERGRARGKSTGSIREIQRPHRMSDEDDSGSEYSTDDERISHTDTAIASRSHGRHSTLQQSSSSSNSPQQTHTHGLKFHHHHTSAYHAASPSGMHSPEDRSSGHSSPANTSPPFGPLVSPQSTLTVGVNTQMLAHQTIHLSPNTHHHSLHHTLSPNSSSAGFFPSSPSSASSSTNGVVSLLTPDLFFSVEEPATSCIADGQQTNSLSTVPSSSIEITTSNPFPLPSVYADFMHERASRADKVREIIGSADLNAEEQSALFSTMKQQFESWLRNAAPQTRLYLKTGPQASELDVQAGLPQRASLVNEEMKLSQNE